MGRIGIALIILALCSFGPIVSSSQETKTSPERRMKLLSAGETAPDWQLSDAEGKLHSLSEYRGKIVVMDFWATWCGPCKEVMPRMQKLYERYQDKEVVVLGVNSWENNDPVALMKKKHYGYGLLLKGEEIAEAYKVTILPVVYIIGADGRVMYSHEGVDDKNLASLIEKYFRAQEIRERVGSNQGKQ